MREGYNFISKIKEKIEKMHQDIRNARKQEFKNYEIANAMEIIKSDLEAEQKEFKEFFYKTLNKYPVLKNYMKKKIRYMTI